MQNLRNSQEESGTEASLDENEQSNSLPERSRVTRGNIPTEPLVEREPVSVQKQKVIRRRDNTESEKEPHISKPSPTVDIHVDPKARRDVTLRLEMDVTEDLVEEFSKLRRIGHFNAARRFFEEHLESRMDTAYVLDQYGQFLSEIPDIHTLTKLAREYPTGNVEKAASAN